MRGEESREPGRYYYHYNRDERLENAPARIKNRQWKSFFSDKGRVIVLLDILFIILVFGLISFLTNRDTTIVKSEGYIFQLTAFRVDSEVLVRLNVTKTSEETALDTQIFTVDFSLSEGEEGEEIKDLLPDREGGKRVVQYSLSATGSEEEVYARIEFDGTEHQLVAELDL